MENNVQHQDVNSGNGGECSLFWASSRGQHDTASMEKINFSNYNGFADIYKSLNYLQKPWNWAALPQTKTYTLY